MKKITVQSLQSFIITNWMIMFIICIATWLRVWQLEDKAILFSDAGRDLRVASQSLEQKTVPLLGIPSSVPRFKQGPVTIWIEMIVLSLFGTNTLAQSLTFALFSVAAVIAIYEFTCIYIGKIQALVAAAMLAVSPLAVANGRVPFLTTPLPLALILFLFGLMSISDKQKYGFFYASLSCAFLFQFELAMAPLFLLIPFMLWYKKIKFEKNILLQTVLGVVVGLLPQIIFDLTHKFTQIGVFMLWIGHKVYEFVSFKGGGSINFENYFSAVWLYGGRIFSTDVWLITSIVLVIIIVGLILAVKNLRRNTLAAPMIVIELSILLLFGSYFVHGSPSEAYFTPFLVLLPIHIAFTLHSLQGLYRNVMLIAVVIFCTFNIYSIYQHNFFVSNDQLFSYGTSTADLRKALSFVILKSGGEYNLKSTEKYEEMFPSFFDNYRWLAQEAQVPLPSETAPVFYVGNRTNNSHLPSYLYRDFGSTRIYWNPIRQKH